MKRIYSKKQYQFLADTGALQSADDEFIRAKKQEYRRQYQREWLKGKRKGSKEIKVYLSAEEYRILADHAKIFGIRSITRFAKEIILASQQPGELVPRKAELQSVLQKVGMAIMQLPEGSEPYCILIEAEQLLIDYLNIKKLQI